jgi:hypothetical protein
MELTLQLPVRFGKRSEGPPVMGDERQQLVDLLHGKHYADCMAGRVFSQATTPLGLAIPIYTATAIGGGIPIWNPPNSGVNLEMIEFSTARCSGTTAFSAIGIMARRLDAIATGQNVTALTEVVPVNGLFGAGNSSKARSGVTATAAAGAAGDFIRSLFALVPVIDTTAVTTPQTTYDFHGSLIVPPGAFVYAAGTKDTVALMASHFIWKEIPI